jgi:hypothetical protein
MARSAAAPLHGGSGMGQQGGGMDVGPAEGRRTRSPQRARRAQRGAGLPPTDVGWRAEGGQGGGDVGVPRATPGQRRSQQWGRRIQQAKQGRRGTRRRCAAPEHLFGGAAASVQTSGPSLRWAAVGGGRARIPIWVGDGGRGRGQRPWVWAAVGGGSGRGWPNLPADLHLLGTALMHRPAVMRGSCLARPDSETADFSTDCRIFSCFFKLSKDSELLIEL